MRNWTLKTLSAVSIVLLFCLFSFLLLENSSQQLPPATNLNVSPPVHTVLVPYPVPINNTVTVFVNHTVSRHHGDCVIRKQRPPSPTDNNPHVYDVFAADDNSRVFFITQRYYGRCAAKELSPKENRDFLGKMFMCQFTDVDSLDQAFSISKTTYRKDAYFATTVITCPIPEKFRALADNKENRALLNVTLIPTHNMHEESMLEPVQNLPVCRNPIVNDDVVFDNQKHQKHYLSACVWTTGDEYLRVDDVSLKKFNISDIVPRIKEWIEFHRMVGFDHFYFYDNSKNKHSKLWNVLKEYVTNGLVTYIHWPAEVCYRHRASQYAAQNSCFRRFAQYNTWMAHFDVDEYMTPLGDYEDLPSILKQYEHDDTVDSVALNDNVYGLCQGEDPEHNPDKTFLFERGCFSGRRVGFKKKEIIKPYKVLYHYVHYTEATWNNKRPKWVMLDDSNVAKLTHTRWGMKTTHRRDRSDPVISKWLPKLEQRLRKPTNQ